MAWHRSLQGLQHVSGGSLHFLHNLSVLLERCADLDSVSGRMAIHLGKYERRVEHWHIKSYAHAHIHACTHTNTHTHTRACNTCTHTIMVHTCAHVLLLLPLQFEWVWSINTQRVSISKCTLVLVPTYAKQGCKNLVTHTHTHLQGINSSASILHWNPVGLPVVCHVKQVVASLALV